MQPTAAPESTADRVATLITEARTARRMATAADKAGDTAAATALRMAAADKATEAQLLADAALAPRRRAEAERQEALEARMIEALIVLANAVRTGGRA